MTRTKNEPKTDLELKAKKPPADELEKGRDGKGAFTDVTMKAGDLAQLAQSVSDGGHLRVGLVQPREGRVDTGLGPLHGGGRSAELEAHPLALDAGARPLQYVAGLGQVEVHANLGKHPERGAVDRSRRACRAWIF